MTKKTKRETPEIVIPKGYGIEDLLDFDDSDFEGEPPIKAEEVIVRYERADGQD